VRIIRPGSAISQQDRYHTEGGIIEGDRGALDNATFDDITTEGERVHATVRSPSGMTRIEGTDERHVGLDVVMVVTDRRLLFVADTAASDGSAGDAGSIEYADVADVVVTGGTGSDGEQGLEIIEVEDVAWEFPLPETTETVDGTRRHLVWLGEVRRRLVDLAGEVERAADEMAVLAEAKDWEGAEAVYGETRRAVDRVADAVFATDPVPDHHLAPELTDIERDLENGYVALYIDRATAHLTLCQHLIETGDLDQTRNVLARAKAQHRTARQHAESLQRGDAFMFGEQRELDQDLDRVGWEIEAVSAEPIRQAHEEKILATRTGDPVEELEHWERALSRYVNVLALEADAEEQHFAGDREEVREEMGAAADELVSLHRFLARSRWNQAVLRHEEGAFETALARYAEAQDHLSRAHELAEQFDQEAAATLATELENVVDSLTRVRDTAGLDQPDAYDDDDPLLEAGPEAGGEFDAPPAAPEEHAGSVSEAAELADSRTSGASDGYSATALRKIETRADLTLE